MTRQEEYNKLIIKQLNQSGYRTPGCDVFKPIKFQNPLLKSRRKMALCLTLLDILEQT